MEHRPYGAAFSVHTLNRMLEFCLQSHVDDIHVVCGCVKDFLRGLKEPLVTYALWKDFVNASQMDTMRMRVTVHCIRPSVNCHKQTETPWHS